MATLCLCVDGKEDVRAGCRSEAGPGKAMHVVEKLDWAVLTQFRDFSWEATKGTTHKRTKVYLPTHLGWTDSSKILMPSTDIPPRESTFSPDKLLVSSVSRTRVCR